MCRRPRSSAPWPPTADPVALSASASERRDARRTAGIAASAGPISPTARLIASIVAVDVEARRDAVEARAEERDDQVGEHDAQPRSEHGSERSEQERGAAVDPLDLPARRADRLHRRDLLRLLADQRRHRVRQQHERGEQRQEGDHRHDRRDLPEQLLARIVAGRADLGIIRKAGEALHRAQRISDGRGRALRGGPAGVVQAHREHRVAGGSGQRGQRLRGRVEDREAALGDDLAAAEIPALTAHAQRLDLAVGRDDAYRSAGPAGELVLRGVLRVGQDRAGRTVPSRT